MNTSKIIKALGRRKPELLLAAGIVSGVGALVCAIKGTVEAVKKVDEEIERRNAEAFREAEEQGHQNVGVIDHLPPKDVIKTVWKCYIPTAVTGSTSMLCLIGSGRAAYRRSALLTSAVKMGETALTEFRQTVEETVDENTMATIKQNVAKKQLAKHPANDNTEIYITGKGDTLCLDATTGRYFASDRETIRQAQNNMNEMLYHGFGQYLSLNDFYDELGLPHTDIGDMLGWNIDHRVDLELSTDFGPKGQPCIVVGHASPPRHNYMNF